MMPASETIHTLEQLSEYTQQIVSQLSADSISGDATVITLHGDLGAGKTTLTQHLARALKVTEEVSSPTFVIAKYYDLKNQTWKRLIHIDAYRLDGEPLEPMGFDELFSDPTNLLIIEWPEYIESVLPKDRTDLSITINDDESRTIQLT